MFPLLGIVYNQKQSGPPDLEETINRFLKSFGKKKKDDKMDAFRRNGGSNEPEGEEKSVPHLPLNLILLVVLFVITFFVMITGFYTVDQSERAVTFRFGKPVGVSQPGLRWVFPFIEDYRIVNLTGVRTVEIGYRGSQNSKVASESLMLTDNLNIIDLQFAVQYVIKDPEDFLYENRDPESSVLQVAETAMREVVGSNNIDFVLYEGREQIALNTQTLMQEILDRYSTGILVQQVAIQNVQPPDQVQDAFEDAIKARQDRERKINEGEAYANNVVPRARGQSARITEEAEAYRLRQIALANGVASRFTQLAQEYQLAPEVTRQRLYLDTLEDVLTRSNKILLDQKQGSNSLIYLPLDRLLTQGQRSNSFSSSPLDDSTLNDVTSSAPETSQSEIERIRNEVRRRLGGGN